MLAMSDAQDAPLQSGTIEIRTHTTELTPELSSAMTLLGTEPVASQSAPDALVGTTLNGNYKVLRVIGEGGMGRVYEAQHTRIAGKRFAIKLLHPEYARQPEVLARFQREAEASAAISHPNVLGVYDVDRTSDGTPFMVSELLEGRDLSKQLESNKRITVAQTVTIARQVCRALHAAHDKGVIHRDVKPENVFIMGSIDDPSIKVLDFGISRLEGSGSSSLTKTGMVIGTPAYMPPEQAAGKTVDVRVDVYGVGAIMYRALTGQLPFGDDEPTVTIAKLLTSEPERPRKLAPEIPESLEMIIQKAMAREPERRYQTLLELEQALAAFDAAQGQSSARTAAGSALSEIEIASVRPQLFLQIVTAVVVAFLGLLGLLDGIVRLARGVGLSKLELALGLLALLGLFGTPLGLLVRHVKKTIWPDTNRVIEIASWLRMPFLVSLAVLGMFSLFVHVFEGISGTGMGAGSALWEILFPLVIVGATVITLRWRNLVSAIPASQAGTLGPYALAGVLGLQFVLVLVVVLAHREPVKEPPVTPGSSSATRAALTPMDDVAPASSRPARVPSAPPLTTPESIAAWKKLDDFMRKRLAKESVDALEQLLDVDPAAPQDKEVRSTALKLAGDAALLRNETSDKMNTLLSTRMGSIGIDLMYELVSTRGGTVAAQDADRMLRDESVRARGTDAMRIAYDIRFASGCEAKRAFFDQARSVGDGRAVMELRLLKECRRGNTCCLKEDKDVDALIAEIEKKGEN